MKSLFLLITLFFVALIHADLITYSPLSRRNISVDPESSLSEIK